MGGDRPSRSSRSRSCWRRSWWCRRPPARTRRVILYGDSLAFEARDAFALSLQSRQRDVEVVDRTFGGTALCDRLDRMRQDLHDLQPWAVAIEFVGNNVTPCMRGPAGPLTGDGLVQKYRDDAHTATELFAGAGVRVYWMGAPPTATPEAGDFARVRHGYESESGRLTFATPPLPRVRYVDAGQAVLDGGRFTATLPCLPSEGDAKGASTDASSSGPSTAASLSGANEPGKRPVPRLLQRRGSLRPRDGAADPPRPRSVTASFPPEQVRRATVRCRERRERRARRNNCHTPEAILQTWERNFDSSKVDTPAHTDPRPPGRADSPRPPCGALARLAARRPGPPRRPGGRRPGPGRPRPSPEPRPRGSAAQGQLTPPTPERRRPQGATSSLGTWLSGEFPRKSLDEWRALAEKEVKGDSRPPDLAHARGHRRRAALHRRRPRGPRGGRHPARLRAVRPRHPGDDVREPAVDDPPVRRASPPPRSRTPSTARTSPPGRWACRWRSTSPPTAATTATTRASSATSARRASRSTRSRT